MKKHVISERLANFLWGNGEKMWIELPAISNAGGVVVMWDSRRLKLMIMMLDPFLFLFTVSCVS